MGIIAAIPALFAIAVALKRSPAAAFLEVYIPVLLLLPDYYRWVLPALPDPTFNEAAILPIVIIFLAQDGRKWKVSVADFFVFGFAFFVAYSEFTNAGFKEAQNLMFDMVGSILFPYIAAKGMIEPKRLRVAFARRVVILMFAVSVVSVYEFKMGMTPWQMIFSRVFPGQGEGWVTTFRYGLARIAGPYGHAILAGLALAVGYRLARWLEWSGLWEPRFKHFRWIPLSKAQIITLGILAGCIMTLVRGPWLGGFAGAMLTAAGRAKNRKLALLAMAGGIACVGIPAGIAFNAYASVGRANAKSDSQETAAYRKELLDKYEDIAFERIPLGWGRNQWPKVSGMQSIDNYYLLLALMHGFIAVGILVGLLVLMIFRLVAFEMKRPVAEPRGSSLGFTLAGIYVVYMVTIATVYMGLTVVPIFALITGWAEGYLVNGGAPQLAAAGSIPRNGSVRRAFRRVVL
jgi:hypothetical protein